MAVTAGSCKSPAWLCGLRPLLGRLSIAQERRTIALPGCEKTEAYDSEGTQKNNEERMCLYNHDSS